MKAVVLAGGRGTRLAPYTNVLPKPLMPVGDMPILEILLRQLKVYGVSDVVIAVGYLASLIQAYVGDGSRFGLNVTYSMETSPLGTAGPLKLVEGLDDTFLIMNGDLLTSLNMGELIQFHKQHKALATISTIVRHTQITLGVIGTDEEFNVNSYTEKPSYDFRVSMGISVLQPEVLEYIPAGKPFDIPDLIKALIADNKAVKAYPFTDGYWLDIGRPDDYQKALDDIDHIKSQILPHTPDESQ
ncbi:MAG: NTP transferase domain-containing protein [Anaerolineaceae bacterium]|nr:NTP transferase domain-containing protein [Anaerolineaceae bacterium]